MDSNFKSGLDIVYLTSCSLNGIIPSSEAVDSMDMEAVYRQAKRHKLQVMTYLVLGKVSDTFYKDIPQWQTDYKNAMNRRKRKVSQIS